MKKIKISSERVYVLATLATSLATSMLASADFGMSMIVAPSYVISMKIPFLTFGQTNYIIQGILFLLLLLMIKKIKIMYFFSFLSGFIFGTATDIWRELIPFLNPVVHPPGQYSMGIRILLFITGFMLNAFGVTLYFKTYFYPQIYEFFVKKISVKYNIRLTVLKYFFDISCLLIAIASSLLLFHRLTGVGIGTIVIACLNGGLIELYDRVISKNTEIRPRWKEFAEKFED